MLLFGVETFNLNRLAPTEFSRGTNPGRAHLVRSCCEREVPQIEMRDYLGGIAVMVGLGFAGWGAFFLLRYPGHGQGKMAVIVGVSAILIGLLLITTSPRDRD